MSRWFPIALAVAFVAAVALVSLPEPGHQPDDYYSRDATREEVHGHAAQESMLADVHYPYGVSPPPEVLAELEGIMQQYPGEGDGQQGAARSLSQWELIGPTGALVRGSSPLEYNSGRVRDLGMTTAGLRVASASGGLWGWVLNIPVSLSDNDVTTQWIGSFDTHPEDTDLILLATGEPAGTAGTGVWRTTDGGSSWTQVLSGVNYARAHRLRFDPFDDQVVHLATTSGYFRSTDAGQTWSTTSLFGDITDMALDPVNQGVLYATVRGTSSINGGPVKSTDGGTTWSSIAGGGWPNKRVDHVALTVGAADPNVVYASVTEPNPDTSAGGQTTVGVFRSGDGGNSWTDVSPPTGYHWGQGYYNNVIAVSPVDAATVLVGGGPMRKTEDSGATWSVVEALHADQHAILWGADGTEVWIGNDGGFFYSNDGAKSFQSITNLLPITQYWFADVCPGDCSQLIGGSQDNGVSATDNGISWEIIVGGDGGGVVIEDYDCGQAYMAQGVFNDGIAWHRYHSGDAFASWTKSNTGLPPHSRWYTRMRHEPTQDIVYTHTENLVYQSINDGTTWTPKMLIPFTKTISDLTISANGPKGTAIYVVLRDAAVGNRFWVLDDGVWVNREPPTTLTGVEFRKFAPDYYDPDAGYLFVRGFNGSAEKIWYTPDRGQTWENRTGWLPNVSIVDLAVHPLDDDRLFLSTTTGMWKSEDAGANWLQFNNGLPNGLMMTELRWCVEDWFETGTFTLIAASYGRSMWERDITVGGTSTDAPPKAGKAELHPPSPNPFNPRTSIRFDIEFAGNVKLEVFDARGRRIRTLLDEYRVAGQHEIDFDGRGLPSGVYHCRMLVGGKAYTQSMALLK